jgi:hypothetical protein
MLYARVTEDMVVLLDREAERTGRTRSGVIEMMMERGRLLGDLTTAGPAVVDLIQLMLRYAAAVERTEGPPTASWEAHEVFREGLGLLADRAAPFAPSLRAPPAPRPGPVRRGSIQARARRLLYELDMSLPPADLRGIA